MVDKSIDPPSTPWPAPHLGPALVPSPPSLKPIDVPKSSMVRLRPLQYQNQYSHAFADLSTPFPPQHLKPARLIAVLQETNVQEAELQSEASFQRLVASHAELPLAFHPRTPRSARGIFQRNSPRKMTMIEKRMVMMIVTMTTLYSEPLLERAGSQRLQHGQMTLKQWMSKWYANPCFTPW